MKQHTTESLRALVVVAEKARTDWLNGNRSDVAELIEVYDLPPEAVALICMVIWQGSDYDYDIIAWLRQRAAERIDADVILRDLDPTCAECNGTGKRECPWCEGQGEYDERCSCEGSSASYECPRCGDSGLLDTASCYKCEGTGTEPCKDCDGTGRI